MQTYDDKEKGKKKVRKRLNFGGVLLAALIMQLLHLPASHQRRTKDAILDICELAKSLIEHNDISCMQMPVGNVFFVQKLQRL